MKMFFKKVIILSFFATLLAACNTHKKPTPGTVKINVERKASLTLFEDRLLKLVQESEDLARDVAAKKVSQLEARMRLNELEAVWTEFANEHPDNLDAQLLYGKFLRSARFDEAAYKVFLRLEKKHQDVAVIKQQLSTFETEQRDFIKAYQHIKEAIALAPSTTIYQGQLGELLYKGGAELVKAGEISKDQRDVEMLGALKTASEYHKNLEFLIRYAQAFYDVDNPDLEEALLVWKKVESLAPLGFEKDEPRIHIANILIELNRLDEAEQVLQKITSQNFSKQCASLKSVLEKKKQKNNSQNLNK